MLTTGNSPDGRPRLRTGLAVLAALAASACVVQPPAPRTVAVPVPPPQKIFVYPNNGQSPEQTDRDRYECHEWAVHETGVDPTRDANPYERVVVQPPASPPGSNTAAGAIAGGILGAILGGPREAGAGLVFGAATGAIVGSAADANAQAQAQRMTQEQAMQAQAQGEARLDTYRRAFGACMTGRGYTVT
jgi:hypothetical protein